MKHNFLLLFFILGMLFAGYAQVAINKTGATPDESSILDVSAMDKGLLIPRVNITDVDSDMTPVESPADGLLVYNIGITEDIPQGFYYWTGEKWTGVMAGTSTFTTYQQSQMYEAAEMYEDNPISTPTEIDMEYSTNYYGWIDASEGETFGGTTTDLEDMESDKIIVGEDGLYKIEFSVSLKATTQNFDLEASIFHTPLSSGISEVTRIRFYRKMASQDMGTGSTHGLIRLLAGDAIDLRFRAFSDFEILNVYNINVIVNKVGEY